ncbi:MAG: DNA (cytosine-5-)-methyltransferase, partial [Acidobacteriota bacterium]|nr:DNA (cytosine-5-)-methyltransferase [Acidobacteriota bacterium]
MLPLFCQRFTFIDLFAGVGGMRMGFEAVGGDCVFTSEWDTWCHKTYQANFRSDQHPISGDITQIDVADIPDHDVLLAGFPCQPFSIAGVSKKNSLGRPHGFECKTQGTLFFDVARILAVKRPRAFLLENVKNLVSHDKGRTFAVICETLEELGYRIFPEVVDSRAWVPQSRKRILIAGFRDNTNFAWPQNDATPGGPLLRKILHPENGREKDPDSGRYLNADGTVLSKFTLSESLWTYLQNYAVKHRAKGNGFGCSVVGPGDFSRTLSARYY